MTDTLRLLRTKSGAQKVFLNDVVINNVQAVQIDQTWDSPQNVVYLTLRGVNIIAEEVLDHIIQEEA